MRPNALAAIAAAVAIGAAFAPALTRAAGDGPKLGFPLACEIGRTCEVQHYVDRDPGPGVSDYRCGHRTYDKHNGIDIRLLDMAAQRRGVDVLAAAPGRVARLRDGVADVSIRAAGAPSASGQECGNGVVIDHGDGWETQYCHLAKGSVRVKVGDVVKAGTPIARVGLSGQTEFPHLHLTLRHASQIVDPFAPVAQGRAACAAQASMWTPEAARALTYKAGVILNSGFAAGPVTNETIEAGGIAALTSAAPALVAYMRVSEPQQGDELELTLRGPDGATLASNRMAPLDRDKAQYFAMLGRKRPPTGWKPGRYSAELKVWRAGKVALQKRIETRL
ncbi:M23 family metallopeptidase [Phenylobacterium sp. LjRoot225]|uniref:M23 family metallopeptidase n=1 Tax=Phenylobacterium sp. LjRoot225 TaxID=3342285 RepID=UPI003ECE55D1